MPPGMSADDLRRQVRRRRGVRPRLGRADEDHARGALGTWDVTFALDRPPSASGERDASRDVGSSGHLGVCYSSHKL